MAKLQEDLTSILSQLNTVVSPDSLRLKIDSLRSEMEIPTQPSGYRNFSSSAPTNWRGGVQRTGGAAAGGGGGHGHGGYSSKPPPKPTSTTPLTPPVGKYQSRFVTTGTIDSKILDTVIGNKLNSFSVKTYDDVRDFILQILDSGETKFIQDFMEKVFQKACSEETYCSIFAKLLNELSTRFPMMNEEMNRYHSEYIKIFDSAGDGNLDAKQHRMGYGLFLSELASLNALDAGQVLSIVKTLMEKVWIQTKENGRTKAVEEYVLCLNRLLENLKERSPRFYGTLVTGLKENLPNIDLLIQRKAGERVSFSEISRCGLMDLKDLIVE